ncbi:hypothetical protein HaLaN_11463, partial [Haematococcus lacustris]
HPRSACGHPCPSGTTLRHRLSSSKRCQYLIQRCKSCRSYWHSWRQMNKPSLLCSVLRWRKPGWRLPVTWKHMQNVG